MLKCLFFLHLLWVGVKAYNCLKKILLLWASVRIVQFGLLDIIRSNQPYNALSHRIDKDTCSFVPQEKANYM